MRLRFFGLKRSRLLISGQSFFRLRFSIVSPATAMRGIDPLPHGWSASDCVAARRKISASGLAGLGQLQPKIKIRFENIWLRRHRLAISRDRLIQLAQGIFHEAQIEPRHIARAIPLDQLTQQGFGSRIILFSIAASACVSSAGCAGESSSGT